jgi:molybdopterin converting factor subunit 1
VLIQVRLFASLRELAGADVTEVELADGATAADVLAALAERPRLAEALAPGRVAIAVNREYARGEHTIRQGDEVALIPPVSGGAEIHVRVTVDPLDAAAIASRVGDPGAGAIVTFQGTTRDVERLEYEAYAEMAEERIRAILVEAIPGNGLIAAAAEHRIGRVPREEASVVVAVSAAHREEAFRGAREAIDRIKAEAPIWKREVSSGSSEWVAGSLPEPPR